MLSLLSSLLIIPDNLRKIAGSRSKSDRPRVHPAGFQSEGEMEGELREGGDRESQRGAEKIIGSGREEETEESGPERPQTGAAGGRGHTLVNR